MKAPPIWMCWFQGLDDSTMPPLNRRCIERWTDMNEGVRVLNDDSIAEYTADYAAILRRSPERTPAAKSDLLRLLLLSRHGGFWVDASVYPMAPLHQFSDQMINETGFFAYRMDPRATSVDGCGEREVASWFLYASQNHYLIERWKHEFIRRFVSEEPWPYFCLHDTLAKLYDSDENIKRVIDSMVQIKCREGDRWAGPCSALDGWSLRTDHWLYKRPLI